MVEWTFPKFETALHRTLLGADKSRNLLFAPCDPNRRTSFDQSCI